MPAPASREEHGSVRRLGAMSLGKHAVANPYRGAAVRQGFVPTTTNCHFAAAEGLAPYPVDARRVGRVRLGGSHICEGTDLSMPHTESALVTTAMIAPAIGIADATRHLPTS